MSSIKAALQSYETAQTAAEEALILGRQLMDTMDLKTHVDQMQTEMNGQCDLKIRSLLEGLSEQLDGCDELITERLASFPPDVLAAPIAEVPPGAYRRLFAGDDLSIGQRLESLLCGYAHYARSTSDAIATVERLSGADSVRVLKQVAAAVDKGLWFIEVYMEGLAIRMDSSRFPDWPRGR